MKQEAIKIAEIFDGIVELNAKLAFKIYLESSDRYSKIDASLEKTNDSWPDVESTSQFGEKIKNEIKIVNPNNLEVVLNSMLDKMSSKISKSYNILFLSVSRGIPESKNLADKYIADETVVMRRKYEIRSELIRIFKESIDYIGKMRALGDQLSHPLNLAANCKATDYSPSVRIGLGVGSLLFNPIMGGGLIASGLYSSQKNAERDNALLDTVMEKYSDYMDAYAGFAGSFQSKETTESLHSYLTTSFRKINDTILNRVIKLEVDAFNNKGMALAIKNANLMQYELSRELDGAKNG
jgi:hypothetical protein